MEKQKRNRRKTNSYYIRRNMREKRRNPAVFMGVLIGVVLIAIIAGIVFWVLNSSGNTSLFNGIYKYDNSTSYEFDGNGTGCMYYEENVFAYKYKVKEDSLKIIFDSEVLADCTYEFVLEEDVLTLIGGEGTIGGTYILYKQE